MAEDNEDSYTGFHEMGLDDRILKAIAHQGWEKPTLIQEKAIPLALAGKDVLARARTGSGKTAAFAIPLIQKILLSKETCKEQCIKALVLTPTKELCNQAYKNIMMLCSSCSREVRCVDISGQVALDAQKPLLMEKPDIVIGTPSRVLGHLQAHNLCVKDSLEMVVIDEADLIFSFGYETDVKSLLTHLPKIYQAFLIHLPKIYQAFLMSATLSDEVKMLKKLLLHNAPICVMSITLPNKDFCLSAFTWMSVKEEDDLIQCYSKVSSRRNYALRQQNELARKVPSVYTLPCFCGSEVPSVDSLPCFCGQRGAVC
ncbi:putative ATP-dependent RNA helicase DDX56 [Lamellibrachia satsuma]|nr:putative ATP-dependent RNA helicase DDX56 [Lamellibrachia satsuma]